MDQQINNQMNALIIAGPGDAKIIKTGKPVPGRGEVLTRVIYSGICGTDLAIYSGDLSFVRDGLIKYPVRIGHEWSGIVEAVGEGVSRFRPGDRVVSDTGVTCGTCPHCLAGDYNRCPNTRALGTIDCWDGSFAEYMLMPERHMFQIPDSVDLDVAALTEPSTIALAAVQKAAITADSRVLVVGTGAIGLAAAALCKYYGARQVLVGGRKDIKLDVAKTVGADETVNMTRDDLAQFVKARTDGKGADVVIETSGSIGALAQCVHAAASKARIQLISFYETQLRDFDIDTFTLKAMQMTGIVGEFGLTDKVVQIMASGKINMRPLITHRFAFDDAIDVIRTAHTLDATKIKILVQIGKP